MPTTEPTREDMLSTLAELKRDKPPGWEAASWALCDALADMEGLPHCRRVKINSDPTPKPKRVVSIHDTEHKAESAEQKARGHQLLPGTAWGEDGAPEISVQPEVYASADTPAAAPALHTAELGVFCKWLAILASEAPMPADALEFWRGCQVLAWMLSGCQETIRELASRLGLSVGGTHNLVNRIKAQLLRIQSVFANQVNSPAIDEQTNVNN